MNQQTTIKKEFDVNDLPEWSRSNPYIVQLAKEDLAFRMSVFDAKTPELKAVVRREADRRTA